MFDYLKWRGDLTFEQCPFGTIDALLLAQFSYLKFYSLIPSDFQKKIVLSELAELMKNSSDFKFRTDLGMVINPRTFELFELASKTERFKNISVCGLWEYLDEKYAQQFAAMTFIADSSAVVAFRGTDDTIAGWKEDFCMAYMEQLPSHKSGIEYCARAFENLKMNLILTGHSKGGNLALYCGAKSGPEVQNKISAVYNFDGPGFVKSFYCSAGYEAVKEKLTNIYPAFSIVGMIMEHPETFEIIKSEKNGVWQHDAVNWQIIGNSFEHRREFTKESRFFHKALNNWLEKLSSEEKEKFIASIFTVIEASGCKSNSEIAENLIPASARMIKCLTKMNKETRDGVFNAIHTLTDVVKADIPVLNLFKK